MAHSIVIGGRVGGDPQVNETKGGDAVASFSVADSRGKDKDPIWFRVSVWGQSVEFVEKYVRKGRSVMVIGRLTADDNGSPRIWEDKEGEPRTSFEVSTSNVSLMDSPPKDEDAGEEEPRSKRRKRDDEDDDEEGEEERPRSRTSGSSSKRRGRY